MKYLAFASAAILLTPTIAHSWLECTMAEYDDAYMSSWKAKAANAWAIYSKSGRSIADGTYSNEQFKYKCNGYPRNKKSNGDWISESTNYSYNFDTEFACRDNQRTFLQANGTPHAVVRPGQVIKMRFWGNGHSRWDVGSPVHRDPGLIRIYWAGKPNTEIVYHRDLTEKYWIPGAQANYTADAVVFPVKNTVASMDEKFNIFHFKVPEKIQNGLHMMVWEWAWKISIGGWDGSFDPNVYNTGFDKAWGTCFTLEVVDSTFTGEVNPDIAAYKPGFNEKAASEKIKSSVCSKSCFIGGNKGMPCTGANCPPCWVRSDNDISCFEYKDGTCPFEGFDCKGAGIDKSSSIDKSRPLEENPTAQQPEQKSKSTSPTPTTSPAPPASPASPTGSNSGVCSTQCFHGGIKTAPCNPAKESCPPCRVSGAGGQIDCYVYDNGKCPFNGQDCSKDRVVPQSVSPSPSKVVTKTKAKSGCDCSSRCFHGGIPTAPCDPAKESCPPCRYPGNGGKIDCYSYKGDTTECPFPNATVCKAPYPKRDLAEALAHGHRRRKRHI